jgi:hypothetical protein
MRYSRQHFASVLRNLWGSITALGLVSLTGWNHR